MPKERTIDALVLRRAGVGAVVAGGVVVVISSWIGGSSAAIGAVLGTALVVIFFSVGQVALGAVLRSNPQMALTMALTLYLVKIGVLLLIIVLFADTTAFDTKAFAAAILTGTLVWTLLEVWIFGTTKVLYVDPAAEATAPFEGERK